MTDFNFLMTIVMQVILGLLTAHFAMRKGKDPTLWFFAGLFFGFLALIFLYFLQPVGFSFMDDTELDEAEKEQAKQDKPAVPQAVNQDSDSVPWFYLDDQWQQQGPVTESYLKQQVAEGRVKKESLVWKPGLVEWLPFEQVERSLSHEQV